MRLLFISFLCNLAMLKPITTPSDITLSGNLEQSYPLPLLKSVVSRTSGKTLFLSNRMHTFETNVPFQKVSDEIRNLNVLLRTLNPNEMTHFRVLTGRTKTFLMSDNPMHLGNARLLCEENSAHLVDFHNLAREGLAVNNTVLLADKIVVSGSRIKCVTTSSNDLMDTDCLNRMTELAAELGLSFHATEKELYQFLTMEPGKKTFHVTVNATHVSLTHHAKGIALCIPDNRGSIGYAMPEIVKGKYYTHLSDMCHTVLEILERKVDALRKTFISTADQYTIAGQARLSLDELCSNIKRLVIGVCLPSTVVSDVKWTRYFETLKDELLIIDGQVRNVTQFALQRCGDSLTREESYDFVFKVYEHLAALHIKLDSYHARYNAPGSLGSSDLLSYRLTLRDDIASGDILECLNQYAGKPLTNREASRLLVAITNAKIVFLSAFHDILAVKDMEFLAEKDLPTAETIRQKRFIWTDPIAALTGLASQSSVDAFNENAKNLLFKENEDAKEILKLENKTNEMLGSIQSQNQKVMKLYADESAMQRSLETLLADESELAKQLTSLSKALEIMSDVDIQFASVMATIDQIPFLIEELETLTMSVVNQRLASSMMPLTLQHHFSLPSLMHADIRALVTPKGFVIRYSVPEITTTFEVIELRTLPFPLGSNLFGKIKLENNLVPISKEGYSFLYYPGTCVEKDSTIMCNPRQITVHSQPITCAEQLAFKPPSMPERCQDTIQAVIPKEQSFIYQDSAPLVTIFTPYKDEVAISCGNMNATVTKHNVTNGLNTIQLPNDCKATSNELVIFASTTMTFSQVVPSVIAVDITGQLLELADDIESAHSLNVTVLEADFAKFANLSGKTEFDFKTVTSELKRFQSVEAMHKFDPLDIQWKEGITVTNTVQALSYGFTLVLLVSLISLCCKCCSCNICSLLFTGIRKTVFGAFSCTKVIYTKCKSPKKPKQIEPPVMVSMNSILEEAHAVIWQMEKRQGRLILYAPMPDGNLYFNHLNGKIEDAYGRELRGLNIKPSAEELMRYLQVLDNMPPPRLEKGGLNDHEYVAEDPDILYDRLNRKFYHSESGKLVSGFKLPPL